MLVALQVGNPKLLPADFADYTLCKLFHCLPDALERQDAETVNRYLAFYNAEQQHAAIQAKQPPAPPVKK